MKQDLPRTNFWISLDVLSWEVFPEGGEHCGDRANLIDRPYQLLRHAEHKLKSSPGELDLVDVITTLKRAAFHRKAALEKIYDFKHIPVSDLQKGTLQRLAFLGIIKPMILGALIDIRDSIEHADGQPPKLDRCNEMVEYIWYFLRSTDPLVKEIVHSYAFRITDSDDPDDHWLEVGTGPSRQWKIDIRGWLPGDMISMSERNASCLVAGDYHRAKDHEGPQDENRSPEDVYVNGKVIGPREALVQFYRHYFSQV